MIKFILQRDKQKHFIVCFSISLSCVIFLSLFSFDNRTIFLAAAICSLFCGVVKETYDKFRIGGSGWSWHDLLADLIGALLGASMIFIGGACNV